ncbi:MAG: hypothetical protein M1834_000654 [Cirrosporium novae-zelandiae]|nr:MAG: hypothetical protein M1834_000654 [Cirrosporium novae-zelandiae]
MLSSLTPGTEEGPSRSIINDLDGIAASALTNDKIDEATSERERILSELNKLPISPMPENLQRMWSLLAAKKSPSCFTTETIEAKEQRELYEISQETYWTEQYQFKRFEVLILYDLFLYQHELVKLQARLDQMDGILVDEDLPKLRNLTRDYHILICNPNAVSIHPEDTLHRWHATVNLPRPNGRVMMDRTLRLMRSTREADYTTLLDSLTGVDLSHKGARYLRNRHDTSVESLLYPEAESTPLMRAIRLLRLTQESHRVPAPLLFNHFKSAGRFSLALIGGLLFVVPAIALTYIESTGMKLVFVSLAVVFFAALISLFTAAKEQEMIGATAAYAAVLVVFLGNAVPSSNS